MSNSAVARSASDVRDRRAQVVGLASRFGDDESLSRTAPASSNLAST